MTKTRHLFIGDAEIASWASPCDFADPVDRLVDIHSGPATYEKTAARVSRDQRLMLAVTWYLFEVDNGGHQQFYGNSTGLLWRDAIKGFYRFGLPELAQIVEESAMRIGKPSLDREEREKQLARMKSDLSDLDDRLYVLEEKLNINEKLLEHIRSHPTQFYLDVMIDE